MCISDFLLNWKQGETCEGEPVQASPLNWRQGQTGEDEPVQASTPNWKQGETGKDEMYWIM